MLSEIVRFEWRYQSRQAAFLAAALLFLLLGFGLSVTRFGPDNVAVNSPYLVMEGLGLLSLVALVAAAVFAANAVLRDDDSRMSEIIHSTPVGKRSYLLGRFGGAFLATLTVAALSGLGMAAGAFMPWIPPERVAAMDARPYLVAFGAITVPNVLFATALLFAVAVMTRNALATYASAVALYLLYFVCAALTGSPLMAGSRPGGGGGLLPSLLDPFALTGFFDATRYWTAAEKNSRFIPLTGALLANRLLWIAAALGILGIAYCRFSFRKPVERRRAAPRREIPSAGHAWRGSIPRVQPAGDSWLAAYRSRAGMEVRTLFTKSTLLLLLLWMGLAVSEIYGGVLTGEYGSTSYPATSLLLAAIRTPAAMIGTILLIYSAAELFWREQRVRMAPLIDSTPVSGTAMIAAKWTALAALTGALLLAGVAACVAVQVSKGYFDLQPFLYLAFFYVTGVPLLLQAAAALLIHTLSPGKYAGMILNVLFVIVSRRAADLGLEHDLWRFAASPPLPYSELNGFAHYAAPFHWLMLHWTLLALLMAMTAAALWRRVAAPLGERLRFLARVRPGRVAWALMGAFVLSGCWIFYNTNVARPYVTADGLADWQADYEKTYKRIETLPRPRVLAVEGEVDLYPAERRYRVAGRYVLVNETGRPIPSVYVATRREARLAGLSIPSARRAPRDDRFGMDRFDFQPPLAPGARAELRFDLSVQAAGFPDGDDAVVGNGTFLTSLRAFPTLGYRGSYEISDPRQRRARGLSGASAASLEEDGERGAVEASVDDWIDLGLTVSTAGDQIAVAPGRLERSWRSGGRRWFRYRTEAPILNRFAVTSGRYTVAARHQGPVGIEIYYHPSHAANVPRMLDTAAAALEVMGSRFGAYPHRELRIVEIPSYQPMAGYALPGTVYLREDAGFLTDARDPDRPDLLARRVAHEVAHQWFGHHLHTANVEGASMLIESLAKYAELLTVERLRGREQVRRLLEIELDRYLSGRAGETYAEVPLYKVDGQPYLFYAKAAVVLFAVRDLLGEEAMDGAIRTTLRESRPSSAGLVDHLLAAADPGQSALIDQWTREIVLYDLRVDAARAQPRPDGRYDVTLRVEAGKSLADGRGHERPLPFEEPVEIAVAGASQVIDSHRHLLRRGLNEIRLVVDSRPESVTVDPWITRIDRNPGDNVLSF